jgi:hypothetical protein
MALDLSRLANQTYLMLKAAPRVAAPFVVREVSMTDLSETSDPPESKAQIDTVGWIFAAFVVVITAIAAMVAYYGNDTMFANAVAGRAG